MTLYLNGMKLFLVQRAAVLGQKVVLQLMPVSVLQYLLLLQKLPAQDSLPPEDFDSLLCPLA